MRRTRSTLTVAAVGVVAFLVPATGAYALWNSTATGVVTVTVAAPPSTLTPPTAISCSVNTQGTVATLSWTAPATSPAPDGYEAHIDTSVLATSTTTTTTVAATQLPANGNNSVGIRALYGSQTSSSAIQVLRRTGNDNARRVACGGG